MHVNSQRTDASTERWECRCGEPPILLGMYAPGGQIEIKLRDRYYWASGCVHATCPRCGTRHVLDVRPADADTARGSEAPVVQAGDPATGWPTPGPSGKPPEQR